MKCIINCPIPDFKWTSDFFETKNPYILPILGKPLIEFYMEFISLGGIKDVLISYEEYDDIAQNILQDGSRWGLNITLSTGKKDDNIKDIVARNSNFVDGGDILYISGFFLPLYDKKRTKLSSPDKKWEKIKIVKGQNSEILGNDISLCQCTEFPLNTIYDYYLSNVDVLKNNSDMLSMKGYGVEEGVFIGMNVTMQRLCKLTPPFIIGNNCNIENGAEIASGAIIGDNCIIDKTQKSAML